MSENIKKRQTMSLFPLWGLGGLYLLLAILGAVLTWYFNLNYMLNSPVMPTVAEFFRQGTATPLAASLTYDLLVAATCGSIFMFVEGKRLRMKHIWVFLLLAILVAFAFAFPLFLYFRERKLRENNQ